MKLPKFVSQSYFLPLLVGLIVLVIGWNAINSFFTSLASPFEDVAAVRVAVPVTRVAPALKNVAKVRVTQALPVQVYAPSAKAELKLPLELIASPTSQVLDAIPVSASERPQTVTTVINTDTGETSTYVKQEPFPIIDVESRGSLSFDYGYKLGGITATPVPVGRVNGRYDFLQIKGIHLGVSASAYTDGEMFIGAGLNYRW